jgi:glycolate oxidase FAD binding subunit
LILDVVVRLHPRPLRTCSLVARTEDPAALGGAASALAHAPAQMDCLDVSWEQGGGEVLARFGGAACEVQAASAVRLIEGWGLDSTVMEGNDGELWERQRRRQRTSPAEGAIVRVSGLPAELPRIIRATERAGGSLAGRAGFGLLWVDLPVGGGDLAGRVEELRRDLAPFACTVLDAPDEVRNKVDVWGPDPSALAVMRRLKGRFDPAGFCSPGLFVGGI